MLMLLFPLKRKFTALDPRLRGDDVSRGDVSRGDVFRDDVSGDDVSKGALC